MGMDSPAGPFFPWSFREPLSRFAVALAIATTALPVIAQTPASLPTPHTLRVPSYWLTLRAVHGEAEWAREGKWLFAETYVSWLGSEPEVRAPLAYYRDSDWSLAAGAQRTAGIGS